MSLVRRARSHVWQPLHGSLLAQACLLDLLDDPIDTYTLSVRILANYSTTLLRKSREGTCPNSMLRLPYLTLSPLAFAFAADSLRRTEL